MTENKISILLKPMSYDYKDEDIIYRIFINDQLIVERSLPPINVDQGINEILILGKSTNDTYTMDLKFKKLTKNCKILNLTINDQLFEVNREIKVDEAPKTSGLFYNTDNAKVILRYEK